MDQLAAGDPGLAARGDDGQELRYYLGLLWRRRAVLAASAAVGLALGVGAALVQTAQYQAESMLRIDMPTPLFMSVSDAFSATPNYWQYQDFYNTEFQVLGSHLLGEKAVQALRLEKTPPFAGSAEPGRLFMSHVRIEPLPQTRLVRIRVRHTDPKEAALWANTLARVYLEQSVAMRMESAHQAYEWLQERLASTQQNMRQSQEKLLESYRAQDVVVPETGGASVLAATMAKFNDDIAQTQARRIELESVVKAADEMKRRPESLDALPQVMADSVALALNARLAERTAELRRLGEKYTSAHPEMRRVQSEIDDLRASRTARANQILHGIAVEADQVRGRERELRAALDRQKTIAAGQTRDASETEALRKEAESSKSLYEVLLQKLNETDIASSLRANNVTIVERAVAPSASTGPDKTRFALVGLGLGLLGGLLLLLGLDLLHDTLKTAEQVEHYLHLDLLAVIPRHSGLDEATVTEAYQNLRTALIFSRADEGGQVVLITGTVPQEGKTTTAVSLGRLLAAAGESTVVVDCDLRRGQLHARLGSPREPGLSDVLAHQQTLDGVVRTTDVPLLSVITSGSAPPNPPALLARKQTEAVLNQLRERFAWVIVDSPPLAAVTDALLLARYADSCLFVVQHDKVNKRLVRRTVQALRKSGASVLGIVLNAVALKARNHYYYYSPANSQAPAKKKSLARRLSLARR